MFSKIDVNGTNACALYQWLKSERADPDGNPDIKWNFTKFLINPQGEVVARFEPTVTPAEIQAQLTDLLT